jgi:hypothetical protein
MPRLRMIVIPKGVAIGLGSRGNWPGTVGCKDFFPKTICIDVPVKGAEKCDLGERENTILPMKE